MERTPDRPAVPTTAHSAEATPNPLPIPKAPPRVSSATSIHFEKPIASTTDLATRERQSQWLNELFQRHPEFLALRERVLPLLGAHSYAHVTHTQKVTAQSTCDRYSLLELIAQHLESIGMTRTAELLSGETGHGFQKFTQPWERTDLRLLTSIAVSHREDAWNLPPDFDHKYLHEEVEEDFFSSSYREDPSQIGEELANPDLNVVYDESGSTKLMNIKYCSLRRFAVYFATQSAENCAMFYLSLNSITSPSHFLEHLVTLYDQAAGANQHRMRVNIVMFIKKWTEYHIGKRPLVLCTQFLRRVAATGADDSGLSAAISATLASIAHIQTGGRGDVAPTLLVPDIPDPHVLFKPLLGILDPPALLVAQQLTLIYQERFAAIRTPEFMTGISDGHSSLRTPTISDFVHFGERIALLVAETFARAEKKPPAYTRILAVVEALATPELGNFDAVASLVRFLRRDEIVKLGQADQAVVDRLAELSRLCGEVWKRGTQPWKIPAVDKAEMRQEYHNMINQRASSWIATIPNMHVTLKPIVRGTRSKESDFVGGLINWHRLKPIAQKAGQLSAFQMKAYGFVAIPQIQRVLKRGGEWSEAQIEQSLGELLGTR
jgi:hypothetical protein